MQLNQILKVTLNLIQLRTYGDIAIKTNLAFVSTVTLIHFFLCFQASRYMTDFDSTHCAPLPAHLFVLPWEHPAAGHNDFVKI